MTTEQIQDLPTSDLMALIFTLIKERSEKILYYTEADHINGYDDDLLALYFLLKTGNYHD